MRPREGARCAQPGRRATTTLATRCASVDSTTKPASRSSARDRRRGTSHRTARGTHAGTPAVRSRARRSRRAARSPRSRRAARPHDAEHLARDVAARVARQLVNRYTLVTTSNDASATAVPRRSRRRASARRGDRAGAARCVRTRATDRCGEPEGGMGAASWCSVRPSRTRRRAGALARAAACWMNR